MPSLSQREAQSTTSDEVTSPSPLAATDNSSTVKRQTRELARIACFFAIMVALTYGVDAIINAGFRRITTSDFGVTNRIVEGSINADIVISGSSRALVHYDPRIIAAATGRSAYNIGRNGSQTDLQLAVLKTYLQHNARPKLVIHNLDLFSFVTSHDIYDPAQYLPYLDSDPIYTAVKRVYPHAWRWKHLPLYGYTVEDMRFNWLIGLKAVFGMQPPEDHFLGFVPRQMEWTGDFEKFKRDNTAGVTFGIEPKGVRDITELIEICRERAIPLLFVYAPEYREMQQMVRNREEIFNLFAGICESYQVPLWDYSHSELSNDRAMFYNSQHLNVRGATAFSADLAHRLSNERDLLNGDPVSPQIQ